MPFTCGIEPAQVRRVDYVLARGPLPACSCGRDRGEPLDRAEQADPQDSFRSPCRHGGRSLRTARGPDLLASCGDGRLDDRARHASGGRAGIGCPGSWRRHACRCARFPGSRHNPQSNQSARARYSKRASPTGTWSSGAASPASPARTCRVLASRHFAATPPAWALRVGRRHWLRRSRSRPPA